VKHINKKTHKNETQNYSKYLPLLAGIEKRRSGRNTKRKKYVDDVEYNFSPEQLKRMPKEDADVAKTAAMEDILGPEEGGGGVETASADNSLLAADVTDGGGNSNSQSGPNYAFVVRTAGFIHYAYTQLSVSGSALDLY